MDYRNLAALQLAVVLESHFDSELSYVVIEVAKIWLEPLARLIKVSVDLQSDVNSALIARPTAGPSKLDQLNAAAMVRASKHA